MDGYEIYREQALAQEEAGVDLFVVETMMTVAEARAAVLAVKSVSTKPVFVTFTCDKDGRTLTGTDVAVLEEALKLYQGRAMYEGSIPEDLLLPLSRKYGLLY